MKIWTQTKNDQVVEQSSFLNASALVLDTKHRNIERDRERQRDTAKDRERQRETERDRERQRETERDRERQRETERDRVPDYALKIDQIYKEIFFTHTKNFHIKKNKKHILVTIKFY